LTFALLKRAPEKFESHGTAEIFGNLASLIGMVQPELAKRLLEPAFADPSWMFGYRRGGGFERNTVLRSALWIEPEWAVELAKRFGAELESDKSVRKLEPAAGLISEISDIVSQLKERQ
jgi:hypothetical protein